MTRWAGGGIILSSVDTRYQLGLVLHAGSVIVPASAPTPHGTWELAMNAAVSTSTSAAKEKWNLASSRNKKPSCGGRIGGTGAPGGGSLISDDTDSPLSGAKAAMYTSPATFGVGAGFGDHHAAVGVTDEQYGAALRGDRALRHRYVVSQRQRGVLHDHYVVPVLLQDPVHGRPA